MDKRDIYSGELEILLCNEGHVHIRLSPDDPDCATLEQALDVERARAFACAILQAADDLAPVS